MEWEEMEQFVVETPMDEPIKATPLNATLAITGEEHTTTEQQESHENSARLPTKPRLSRAAKNKQVKSTDTPAFGFGFAA